MEPQPKKPNSRKWARSKLIYAVPISLESMTVGLECHRYWWPHLQAFRECMDTRRNILEQADSTKNCPALPEEIIRLIEDCLRAEGRRLGKKVFNYWHYGLGVYDHWVYRGLNMKPLTVPEGIPFTNEASSGYGEADIFAFVNKVFYRHVMVVQHLYHTF